MDPTQTRVVAAAAVLALAIGGVVYARSTEKKEQQAHSATAASADLPSVDLSKETVDKVTKLEIKNADKSRVVLEKKGDEWMVVEPVKAKANAQNVKSLLDNLKDIKIKESIDRSADRYAQLELTDDKAVHVVAYEGDKKVADLYFGKSGSRGQTVRLGEQPGVFVASGYSGYMYQRDAAGWRDKSVLELEEANVASVEVRNKNGVFSFSKNGDKWTATFAEAKGGKLGPPKPLEKFDEAKIKDMLRAYKSLKADDFADEKADTGLANAEAEGGIVKITLKDNGGQHVIKVGKTAKGASRYAVKEGGDGTVYTLSSWNSEWATAEPKKFQKSDEKKDDKAGGAHGADDGHGHGLEGLNLEGMGDE